MRIRLKIKNNKGHSGGVYGGLWWSVEKYRTKILFKIFLLPRGENRSRRVLTTSVHYIILNTFINMTRLYVVEVIVVVINANVCRVRVIVLA